MMTKSNLDKFLKIESMMEEAKALMTAYEEALEERYEYMNDLRREYSNLSYTLGRVAHSLKNQSNDLEENESVKTVVKTILTKLDDHIEALEEEKQYSEEDDDTITRLKRAREQLEGKIDKDNITTAWKIFKARGIRTKEIDVLMNLMDSRENNSQGTKEEIIRYISNVQDEYVSSFVTFRKSYDEDIDVSQIIGGIISKLEDAGYSQESRMLEDAKPSTTGERGVRPDPEPLLNVLNPIKSAGLEYYQSNHKNSESYSLNVAFAKEVAYTRRALLENREYKGTNSAFTRLKTAFNQLSSYMYERFYQLGGEPKNYHGHDDRKNKK